MAFKKRVTKRKLKKALAMRAEQAVAEVLEQKEHISISKRTHSSVKEHIQCEQNRQLLTAEVLEHCACARRDMYSHVVKLCSTTAV